MGFVKRHPVGALIALACVVLVLSLQSCASSLISLGNAAAGAVGATTYPAQDGDMRGGRGRLLFAGGGAPEFIDPVQIKPLQARRMKIPTF